MRKYMPDIFECGARLGGARRLGKVARQGSCEEYALLEDARASEHEHGLGIGCSDARDARKKKTA